MLQGGSLLYEPRAFRTVSAALPQHAVSHRPRVTVWLTSYQHARFLRRAVESVLCQTYRSFELVAMDDHSQDGSWELLQEYAARFPGRVRVVRHTSNRGGSHIEEHLDSLRGEYIAVLHSDDAWAPRKLERQVAYLDAHPEIAACFTAVEQIDDCGQPLRPVDTGYEPFRPESHSPAGWLRRLVLGGNCLCHPSVMLRRWVYRLPGALAQGLYSLPDYHRWLVLAAQGQGIAVLPQTLTFFRLHADKSNTSADVPRSRGRVLAEQMLAADAVFAVQDAELLRQAFPEAEPWLPAHGKPCRDELTFAVAKVLLQPDRSPGFKAEAARRLYSLLNCPESAALLQRRYGYNGLVFQADLAAADPFDGAAQWYREQKGIDPQALRLALVRQTARTEAAEAALQAMRQSRSWRITAPLRRLRHLRG